MSSCHLKTENIPHYSFNQTSNQFEQCFESCSTCSGLKENNNHNCLTCASNYYPLQYSSSQCYNANCTTGYTLITDNNNNNLICGVCSAGCYSCQNYDINNCTKCANTYFPFIDNLNNCSNIGSNNYYFDSLNQVFQKCHFSCLNCIDSSTNCIKCQNNYKSIINTQKCVSTCPNTTIAVGLDSCGYCSAPCNTCKNKIDFCTSCLNNLSLVISTGKCYETCPDKYYLNILNNTCEECLHPCNTCSSMTQCTTCITGYYLLKSTQCLSSCPEGYFENPVTFTCDKCDGFCKTCGDNNYKKCTSCFDNYLLTSYDVNKCSLACSNGYFQDSKLPICNVCSSECGTCFNTKNNCTSCSQNKYFLNNQCVNVCPNNYYIESKQCLKCHISCSSCTGGDAFNCLQCSNDYPILKQGQCTNGCLSSELIVNDENGVLICLKVSDCILSFDLDTPAQYSINSSTFSCSANYTLKLSNLNCSNNKDKITSALSIVWNSKGELSSNNQVLTINTDEIPSGFLSFSVSLLFQKSHSVSTITKQTYFRRNRVNIIFITITS